MARQVLPWVGMAIGSMVGAPQIGFMVGSLIGNAIDPQVINGPKLGEGQDNQASEGGYRPIVLGKGAVGVCMIHEGPLKKRTIRHKQSKGGGPVTTEERAYRTMAFALGESAFPGKGVRLTRLWIDNKLRYDITPTSQIQQESAEFESEFTFYPGDNNQQPDPDLEAFLGAGNVPSYRGGSPYIVFPDWDVTDSRGMAPMIKAELVSEADPPAKMMVFRNQSVPPNHEGWMLLDSDYAGSWVNDDLGGNFRHAVGVGSRVIVWTGSTSHHVYTDDLGQNWTDSSGVVTGNASRGWAAGDKVMIAAGTSFPIRFSANRGTSFTEVGGPVRAELVTSIRRGGIDRWLIHYDNEFPTGIRYSDSDGGSWSAVIPIGITNAAGGDAWSDNDTAMFCGRSNSSSTPVAFATDDGVSYVGQSLPVFVDATVATAVCGHNERWLLGTDSGEVAYRDEDGMWHLCPDRVPNGTMINKITHNGSEFVLIAGPSLTQPTVGNGYILSSLDGTSLVVRRTEYIGVGVFDAIVAIREPTSAQKIPLSSIVQWIHGRVDLPSGRADVTQLDDLVEGIVFSDGYTAADAIRTQMALYFFDAGEYDAGIGYRINYVKRGGSASVTLTEADIVDGPEDWEREDSYERPRALHVAYQNPVADYGAPNITIKRTSPDVLVVGERSASVPNVFSDVDEITQRADIMMTVIYSEIAGTYDITLPVSWLELAPTDCIGFSIRGRTRRLRLTNWRFSPDGTIKTEWMADRQSAYTSNVTGLPVVPPTPPPPSIVGPTVSAVLDIPALVDALDSLHLVISASGQTEAWYGSIHQRKLPSDADFATMAQFSAPTTIMGTLQVAVSSASPHYTDTTNVVRVQLYSDDDLDTYTQEQFLSEHGAFAIAWDDGGVRRWEVCQYRDAVKVGDMEWELSTLLRGRLNTEAEAHPIGSLFVLLDSGIRVAPAQSSWIGQDITHRAVSNGQLPDNAVPYVETYTGESQREWPVAHVFLDLVGDILSVDIVPRHRFGTDDHPVRSLNWDGYRIEATDGVNSDAMTTTSDGGDFDVTGWSGTITVTVAQLNRITGAGPTVSETIEA